MQGVAAVDHQTIPRLWDVLLWMAKHGSSIVLERKQGAGEPVVVIVARGAAAMTVDDFALKVIAALQQQRENTASG